MKSLDSLISRARLLSMTIILGLMVSACSDQEQASTSTPEPAPEPVAAAPDEPAMDSGDLAPGSESETALALFDEGLYLSDVGRGVQAREKFIAAIAEDPAFVRAYYEKSNVALSFQDFKETLEAADALLDGASEADQMFIQINNTFLSNDPEKGLSIAMKLVELFPQSGRAQLALGAMLTNQNRNVEARGTFETAHELMPDSPAPLASLAANYLFNEPRDFAMAEQWAMSYMEAFPQEAKTHEMLGDVHRGQNNLEAALASYVKAGEIDPTLDAAALKTGHVNSFLGNIDDARAAYDRAVALAPPESKASFSVYKGFTQIHGGDIPAAIDELEALAGQVEAMGTPANQVKGNQVFALTSASVAALHAGLLDRAADLIKQRNALLMAIAEDVGTDDARRLQTVAGLQFDGLLAAYSGDTEAAANYADEMLRLVEGDDNPRRFEGVHYTLGMSALKAGDFAKAVEHLRQADFANNMFIRYHLAMAEEGNGNAQEAAALYEQVATYNFNSVGFALIGRDAQQKAAGG